MDVAKEKALILKRKEGSGMQSIFQFYYIEDGELMTKGIIQGFSDEDEVREIFKVLLEKFLAGV